MMADTHTRTQSHTHTENEVQDHTPQEPPVEQDMPVTAMLLAGEIETGKTHTLLCMCDAVLDLEERAHLVTRKLESTPYVHKPRDWKDCVRTVKQWCTMDDIKIIGVDTARLLEVEAEKDAVSEVKGDTLYSKAAGAGQYNKVYKRIKDFIGLCRDTDRVLILTCHMKPEYMDNKPTGRMLPEAPKNMNRTVDFIISRCHGAAWPTGIPDNLPKSCVWWRVDKDCMVWKLEQPPYVVCHVPRNRPHRINIYQELLEQLLEPATDVYWTTLENRAREQME